MSTFNDYQRDAVCYDVTRQAVGVDIFLASLIFTNHKITRNLSEIHLLDAGCGTGNYAEELLEAGVGKVSLLDASAAMLSVAKNKLDGYIKQGRVPDHKEGVLPNIPFPDKTFDAILFSQNLHHLDQVTNSMDDSRFPNIAACLKEGFRVLKPGGVLLINFSTSEQVAAEWYIYLQMHIYPDVRNLYGSRFPDTKYYLKFANDAGFQNINVVSLNTENMIRSAQYENLNGPLSAEWRSLSSNFGVMNSSETDLFEDRVRKMNQDGSLKQLYLDCEVQRLRIGQSSCLSAFKPLNIH